MRRHEHIVFGVAVAMHADPSAHLGRRRARAGRSAPVRASRDTVTLRVSPCSWANRASRLICTSRSPIDSGARLLSPAGGEIVSQPVRPRWRRPPRRATPPAVPREMTTPMLSPVSARQRRRAPADYRAVASKSRRYTCQLTWIVAVIGESETPPSRRVRWVAAKSRGHRPARRGARR